MISQPSYRPDIDGLRAVAVMGVVLYHYGATWLPGGFTGVDIFFVISGYLITSILRKQMEAGSFSVLAFYDRRIRRIVPALLVMLASTLVLGWVILMPGDYADLGESAAYASVGLGNLYFFWNTGYFDRAAELHPLLHTWSLGVEEQFYLVWPLVLWLGLTFINSKKLLTSAGVVLLVLLFAYSIWMVGREPKAAFYLPMPRAWELLIGASLVFVRPIDSVLASGIVSATGIAAVGWSLLAITATDTFPGWGAVYACIGAACLIFPKQPNWISAGLSWRPFVLIGLISYSLYLWHWPILVLFRHYNNSLLPTPAQATLLIALSAGVATASWRYVEQPFRHVRASNILLPGFAAMFIVAVAGVAITGMAGVKGRVPDSVEGMHSLAAMWKWQCPQSKDILGGTCAFGSDWDTAGRRVILWGESNAEHFAPLLQQVIPSDTSVLLLRGCLPIVDNVTISRHHPEIPDYSVTCADSRKKALDFIEKSAADTVILASAWAAYQKQLDRPSGGSPAPSGADLIREGLETLSSRIETAGPSVVIIADIPQRPGDPIPCAISAYSGLPRAACSAEQLALNRAVFDNIHGPVYAAIHEVVEELPGRRGIFPGEMMCGPIDCITSLLGEPLYRDTTHLRRNLSPETLRELANMIGLHAAFENP